MNIEPDDLIRFCDGEEMPPALERRVAQGIEESPELLALAGLLNPTFLDDDEDLDPQLLEQTDRLVDLLWDSCVAQLIPEQASWPAEGAESAAQVVWGHGLGESSIKLVQTDGQLRLLGAFPEIVRPLCLMRCDHNFLGVPGSLEETRRQNASATTYRVDVPLPPMPEDDSSIAAEATADSKSLALESERAEYNSSVPYVSQEDSGTGVDLIVPVFPVRDRSTHREVLVAIDHTTGRRSPFVAERVESHKYLAGRVMSFRSEEDSHRQHRVSIGTLTATDWPLLSPGQVTRALAQAVPVRRELESIEGGAVLAPFDSGSLLESASPASVWLIRYTTRKGGK